MKTNSDFHRLPASDRQGSTLVIVIALLGLLAFMGMVFFTFAAQERQADSLQMLRSAEQMAELARNRLEKGDISEQEFARVAIETERARGDDHPALTGPAAGDIVASGPRRAQPFGHPGVC